MLTVLAEHRSPGYFDSSLERTGQFELDPACLPVFSVASISPRISESLEELIHNYVECDMVVSRPSCTSGAASGVHLRGDEHVSATVPARSEPGGF